MAASLENLAVFAYKAGLAAATAGKLGTVPPAIGTFATTALSQHTQHAAAWNAVLKSNGKAKVTVTNPMLTPTVQANFAKVTDITGLAQLALSARERGGGDLSGRDLHAEEQGGHRSVRFHRAGRDAAHRHPLLRDGDVPGCPDHGGYADRLQLDRCGGLGRCECG